MTKRLGFPSVTLWLATLTLLLVPSPALAQCWQCFGDPPVFGCIEVTQDGWQECTVNCSGEKCKCTTKSACKAFAAGRLLEQEEQKATPRRGVTAPSLTLEEGRILVYGGIGIDLTATTLTALESIPWMLATYLETANQEGQLLASVIENGLFSDKSRNEVYAYRGQVTISPQGVATINLELLDHPQIQTLRAEVREAGNRGSVTILDSSGRATTQTWQP